MKLIVATATPDVIRFIFEAPEGCEIFKVWHNALLRFAGTMPLYFLKHIASAIDEHTQCPWDTAIKFLIEAGASKNKDRIEVKLVALNSVFKAPQFFKDPNEC
jgi:hypothetical protein